MNLQFIKREIKSNYILFKLVRRFLSAIGYWDAALSKYQSDEHWNKRAEEVKRCPDNLSITTVPDAGKIRADIQLMHNGIKIHIGSYYGWGNTKLLMENKGIHEPQEERVFGEALKTLPTGAVMIELGAFWSFYSMWFNKEIKEACSYMIEPDPDALLSGKNNFRLNSLKGDFTNAYVTSSSRAVENNVPGICIDDFVEKNQIPFIHILHSDIQGCELEMLHGAIRTIELEKIGYLFISTHSNALHYQCLDFLQKNNFQVIASADLDQTYSWDGLLVARHRAFPGLGHINISLKTN